MKPLAFRPEAPPPGRPGYLMIMLLLVLSVLALGLLVAVPVWETELRREAEEELIFRGRQYAEAVRIFQEKNPGRFPKDLKELAEQRCLRKLFRDPMSPTGEWNIILNAGAPGGGGEEAGGEEAAQRVLVAPEPVLEAIPNPVILGVVSSSKRKSIRIYDEQESYDKWLFFFGKAPGHLPEIVYYGEEEDKGPFDEEKTDEGEDLESRR